MTKPRLALLLWLAYSVGHSRGWKVGESVGQRRGLVKASGIAKRLLENQREASYATSRN